MAVDSIGNIQNNYEKYADYFSDTKNDTLSVDSFYELLLAEMTNQDPMEPTSNTEFVSQLATYSSLNVQKDALYYSNANYAASLVGKEVIVAVSTGASSADGQKLFTDRGTVTAMTFEDEKFNVTVNGKSYSLSNIMEVVSTDTQSTVSSDGAFATSLIGRHVTVQATDSSGATVLDAGIVKSLEIENGVISVIVNDMAYKVSDVVKVEEATDTVKDQTADEAQTTDAELKELFG